VWVLLLSLAQPALAAEAIFVPQRELRLSRVVVRVNGRQIIPAAQPVRVRVGTTGFDRVEVLLVPQQADPSPPSPPWVLSAQFQGGVEYLVRENACSFFEIWPKVEPEGDQTQWVRFRVAPGVRQAIEFKETGAEPVLVRPGETTPPLEVSSKSAMCPHAASGFDALPSPADWETGRPKHLGLVFATERVLVIWYLGPKAELALTVEERPAGLRTGPP
jgi:hypothetical protein